MTVRTEQIVREAQIGLLVAKEKQLVESLKVNQRLLDSAASLRDALPAESEERESLTQGIHSVIVAANKLFDRVDKIDQQITVLTNLNNNLN